MKTNKIMPPKFTKQYVQNMAVADVLRAVYESELLIGAINDMSREKLAEFITEAFDKGHLNYYLNIKP